MDPDVSAFTILEMLRQLGDDPTTLKAALGSIYEELRPITDGWELWRSGTAYAQVVCAQGACDFAYWDATPRAHRFALQATMWAETEIGPLSGAWPLRTAASNEWTLEIGRTHTGGEGETTLKLRKIPL